MSHLVFLIELLFLPLKQKRAEVLPDESKKKTGPYPDPEQAGNGTPEIFLLLVIQASRFEFRK